MRLFYTDHFELPLPDDHRFPMSKYRLLRERVATAEWARDCELIVPDAASDEQLALVHDQEYLHRVAAGELSEKEVRRIGFPWSPELVERSRRSTGATIAAARAAIRDGVSVNMAGGTHHAFRDRGEGFCVFNDAATAAAVLRQEMPEIETVLVVDCDVHQGNGTAAIFANEPSVTTFSMHGKRNYPLQKIKSDVDLAFDSGTTDTDYLQALEQTLTELLTAKPDFVFYLAGADPFEGDRLGRLSLTKQGLRDRDEMVIGRCREQQIPVAIAMAGGYAEDVNDIVDIHANTIRVAVSYCPR